jgi:hypothetical protein
MVKQRSINDSQYLMFHVTNLTPPGSECNPTVAADERPQSIQHGRGAVLAPQGQHVDPVA